MLNGSRRRSWGTAKHNASQLINPVRQVLVQETPSRVSSPPAALPPSYESESRNRFHGSMCARDAYSRIGDHG